MRALRRVGVPYTDEEIAGARRPSSQGKTEMDALIAYLQVLGTALKTSRGEADHGHQHAAHRRHGGRPSSPSSASSCWAYRPRASGDASSEAARCRSRGRRGTESDMSEFTTRLLGRSTSRIITVVSHRRLRACCCQAQSVRKAAAEPETTGHVWDEDLRRVEQPAAALVDVAVLHHHRLRRSSTWCSIPGLGSYAGTLGWTQVEQLRGGERAGAGSLRPDLRQVRGAGRRGAGDGPGGAGDRAEAVPQQLRAVPRLRRAAAAGLSRT